MRNLDLISKHPRGLVYGVHDTGKERGYPGECQLCALGRMVQKIKGVNVQLVLANQTLLCALPPVPGKGGFLRTAGPSWGRPEAVVAAVHSADY